ncbi:MAG: leucine-rich repeat domain-containing protein [Opitutaceae bacterium]|nr:leucine-rich repeat domain-containing protein [Cytophagales bacterium]
MKLIHLLKNSWREQMVLFNLIVCSTLSYGQTVSLPDTNFRNFLKKNYPVLIDFNGDLIIAEAGKVTGEIIGYSQKISSLEGIQFFTKIQGLNFSKNNLKSIPDINAMKNLEVLNISNNKLENLPSLSGLKKIKALIVPVNFLQRLPDLSLNDSLVRLDLHSNLIDTLTDLSKLVRLDYLNILNNQVRYIPGLDKLVLLDTLIIWRNNLLKLPSLENINKLAKLDASQNKLDKVPDFGSEPAVQILLLDRNNLSTLPDFSIYKKLSKVNIYGNKLSFKELTKLTFKAGYDTLFDISPQQTFLVGKKLQSIEGEKTILSTGIDQNTAGVTYEWFKNGFSFSTVTNDSLKIINTSFQDSGKYICVIKHPSFPNFALQTDTFVVSVKSCVDVQSLSTSVTDIICKKAGSLFVMAPSKNKYTYELKSPVTQKIFTSTTGRFDGLTEPVYKLSVKTSTGCSKAYPVDIKIPGSSCKDYLITPDNDGNMDTFFFEASGKVEIFDKRGNMVKRLSIPSEWDCSSDKGKVASGYYIANINDGESQIGLSIVY